MIAKNNIFIFSIILLLGELGAIATDIYIPSLPAIAETLNSPPSLIKLTIGIYLVSFGFSQLIYGPLSDCYGRRKVVTWGLLITVIASIGCVVASSINMLLIFRFIQGLGAGAGTVMARAIMMDVYERKVLIKINAYYSLISAQALTVIPILGGYIQVYLGWRANFVFILIYSLMTIFLIYKYLPETNKTKLRRLKIRKLLNNYWIIITNKIFLSCVLCSSLCLSSLIVYITTGPFLFQKVIGLNPIEFGYLSIISCAAVMTGSLFNSQFISRLGTRKMFTIGVYLMLTGGVGLFLPVVFDTKNLILIMSPIFMFMIGTNLVFSCTAVIGLHKVRRLTGSAGALFGAVQMFISSLIGTLFAVLTENSVFILAITFTSAALFVCYLFYCFINNKIKI